MLKLLAALAACLAMSAHAEPTMTHGVVSVRLLDSECSSEVAIATLQSLDGKTKAKRADVMIAGEHVSACYAEDEDGDILLADREGGSDAIYRRAFTELQPRGRWGT